MAIFCINGNDEGGKGFFQLKAGGQTFFKGDMRGVKSPDQEFSNSMAWSLKQISY